MRTEHALRYLLLRHLKRRERLVPPARFLEATRSLCATVERDALVVTWRGQGTAHVRRYARDAFTFYARGDREPGSVDADLRTDNDALAEAFADEVFGPTTRPGQAGPPEAAEAFPVLAWVDAGVFGAALATLGGLGLATGAGLFAVRASDLVRGGQLAGTLALLLLALAGPPVAALLGALVCLALEAIDPNPARRAIRVGLSLAAVVAAGARLATQSGAVRMDAGLAAVAVLTIAVAIVHALHAGHFRALALVLPFYCLGLYVDGHVAAALLGVGLLLAATVVSAYAHRWVPVQRERSLTPNG